MKIKAILSFVSNRLSRFAVGWRGASIVSPVVLGCILIGAGVISGGAQTATWTGGNTFKNYGTAANWNPAVLPLNQFGVNYTVIVPDTSSLVYDVSSNGVIDALSFGVGGVFRFTNQHSLLITGPALVKGQVEAAGAGSAFRAPTNTTVLSANPRLLASDGGQIQVGASTYSWDRYNASATLLSALGLGSLVDVKAVNSMIVSYGDSGAWTYGINARSNGVVDLSGLTQITGPGQDDWLEFNLDTGGNIKLDALRKVTGRTRFNVAVPLMEFPLLDNASGTFFTIATNATVRLPALISYDSATLTVGQNATVEAPSLVTMDGITLNLANNSSFRATNLAVYKNADIPIRPGRNFQPGLLTDIYGSRITVSGGSSFTAGALSYDTPGDWRSSPTLFSSEGPGSLLNLSAMKSFTIQGGYGGAWNYSVTANSNGVINFSGLETITGARSDTYDNEDNLVFNVLNGGNIRFDSLRQVTRRTRFNLEVPLFDLPALESADTTIFSLANGVRLNATNLTKLDNCTFSFGFNSTLYAPKLGDFINTTLALSPGVIVSAPPFTNILGSRFTVSGGTQLRLAATSYDSYGDWRWSPTLFGADGSGSVLDVSALKTIKVYGGHYNTFTYGVIANNNGVIDLSGLESVSGADPAGYGNDDWLGFSVQNGGNIRLDSLRQTTRRTRFDIGVSNYQLPALEQSDNTYFNLADGSRLDLPRLQGLATSSLSLGVNGVFNAPTLTNVNGGSYSLGLNSTLNAPALLTWNGATLSLGLNSTCNVPNLLNFQSADLALSPGRTFNAPFFTNIYSARLAVSGGSSLQVAAPSYETPEDWRTSATLFSADGAGSVLNLASLKMIKTPGGYGGAWTYAITANNNGLIDLSGLETATGGRTDTYDNEDWLAFNVRNSGQLRLGSLRQITGRTRFNIEIPLLELPALAAATNTTFTLADGSRVNLTNLTSFDSGAINFGYNSTFDAPKLVSLVNSTLSLGPGKNFTAAPFTNIFASLLSVSGGSVLHVSAPSYETWTDWRGSLTLFSADGLGSLIEAAAVKSFKVYGGHYNTFTYLVAANNGGVVDFSGLDTITGGDPANYGNDDWLRFSADTTGLIKFGNASVTRRTQFSASGQTTRLQFAGLYLRPNATLTISGRASLEITGDYLFENTDPNSIQVDGSYLQMDGAQPQVLEAGGKNLGPAGASSKNFGYGQLIVGSSNQTSIVRLKDTLNNGQRGTAGESEALYLYGLDGQGLRLLNHSRLIIGTVPVYALVGGQMQSLGGFIPAGTNSAAFDGGFVATTGGPKITAMVPAVTVTPPVSSVDVTFDIPINGPSFTTADVVLTGPAGPITPTGVAPVTGNTYRLSFPPQTGDGAYTVKVGPAIDELAQNLPGMDQNGNGLSGEPGDVFTGNFAIDGQPPVVVTALSLQNGTRVGVTFDEPVSPAFATNTANYIVNDLPPRSVVLLTNGSQVALEVGALVGESFVLKVNNVADALGNTTNRTVTGVILPMESRDIGVPGSNPVQPGSTLTFDGLNFTTLAGGSDYYWNGTDAGHFASEGRVGDFDVQVQVAGLDRADTYSQAGLMWRESTASNSRRVYVCLNSPQGGNRYWAIVRWTPGSAGVEWPGNSGGSVGSLQNVWLRLKRAGSEFVAYRGADGTNWTEFGRITADFPVTGLVGLATDARNNSAGVVTTAYYRNYSDITPAIIAQPQSQSVASGANLAFGVTARGLPALTYQWTFNGLVVSGATSSLLSLTGVTTNNVGDYRVMVTNPYGSVTSQVAALVVDGVGAGGFEADVTPPPYGNNSVSVADWVRLGRLVVGLEAVSSSSEFQRSDCAPRTNAALGTLPLGDGRLTVADWTQAGRYAAALDPLTPAGGTNQPATGAHLMQLPGVHSADAVWRQLRVVGVKAALGQTFPVAIELVAAGDENGVGFSLNFDPARLAYVGAELGDGVAGGTLQVNANQAGQGRLGIVLVKPAGENFASGATVLMQVRFTALGEPGSTPVSLGDLPVVREIASVSAEVRRADYLGGAVGVILPARLSAPASLTGGGAAFDLGGQAGELYRIEVSTDLVRWEWLFTQPAGSGPIRIQDPVASPFKQRFYRAVPQQ